MRYYLYRDIELLKEIYSQFTNMRLDLDVIERIDAKTCFEEEGLFAEPEVKLTGKNESRVKLGGRTKNALNTTTINECANISEVKDIYVKRFYHNLICDLEKNREKCSGIFELRGKMECITTDKQMPEQFVQIDDTYVWFECSKMSNDIHVVSSITDKINVVGCLIMDRKDNVPRIVKAIAMYVEA